MELKSVKGLIHIYTGDGKGKTTAAVGLGVRACGRGMRVLMVQFLKSMPTGEMAALKALEPNFILFRGTELKKFTWQMDEIEKLETAGEQESIFEYAVNNAIGGACDLLILDEVLGAVSEGMLGKGSLLEFMKNKPEALELVLTGRGAADELIELADYVSEIYAVKHPADKGINGREGIEY